MKPDKLRDLLEEVISGEADECGPNRSAVLQMVRQERTRRRRLATMASAAAILLFGGVSMIFWTRSVSPPVPGNIGKHRAVVFEAVDDNQALARLEGTAAAFLEWPNGERTLLVVEDPVKKGGGVPYPGIY